MQFFKREVSGRIVILRHEGDPDFRVGGSLINQIEARSTIEAFKDGRGDWRIPLQSDLTIWHPRPGEALPYSVPCSKEYAQILDEAPWLSDADALFRLNPVEAYNLLLWIKSAPEAGDVTKEIDDALKRWGLPLSEEGEDDAESDG